MVKKAGSAQRRSESLSREQIVEASIALLDSGGESGLTFRALSGRLATGPGTIYWHIDNKRDLLTAACDAVVARATDPAHDGAAPRAAIRELARRLFETIDAHPWVGAALTRAPGALPMVRILERLGRQVQALGVPARAQWAAVSALSSYILGVSGQNAANALIARELDADRDALLGEVATVWAALDPDAYPFTRGIAAQLRAHDDRDDFLAGIDLIVGGIEAAHGR